MSAEKDIVDKLTNYSSNSIWIPVGMGALKELDKAMKDGVQDFMKENEEKKKVTVDPRKQKIRDLKNQIKLEEGAITEMLGSLTVKEELELPKEEQDKRKEDFRLDFSTKKALISSLKDELKAVRINRLSSSFFEWIPNKNMNRQQARAFRRNNK